MYIKMKWESIYKISEIRYPPKKNKHATDIFWENNPRAW